MRKLLIDEDVVVMETIETLLINKTKPISCTITYGANTTEINYNHIFQYLKLNSANYTLALDLNNFK